MPVIEGTERLKTAVAEYNFAVDGGAVGAIPLRGTGVLGGSLPVGSVVTSGYVEVITPPTSGGAATLGVSSEAAGDLVAAGTLVSAANWATAGRKSVTPAGTGSTSVKTTAARGITADVGVAALTAGFFRVVLVYR